jgi:hypothetical protein
VCVEEEKHYGPSQWILAANMLVVIVLVWNGFVRGFIVLSYVPKLVDGAMPFALAAALSGIGFIGYVNAEVNARINPKENAHIMTFF